MASMKALALGGLIGFYAVSSCYAQSSNGQQLSLEDAREYMLELINKDRTAAKLKALTMDDTAQTAGQLHADEMSTKGYCGHWESSGKKPTQRYTESGGDANDEENCGMSSVFTSESTEDENNPSLREKTSPQTFTKAELEAIENGFITEKPPNDGHRQNILTPSHTAVGIGLSKAGAAGGNQRTTCSQEFLSKYGTMERLPKELKFGSTIEIKGTLLPQVKVYSVGIAFEPQPSPMTIKQLLSGDAYSDPESILDCFPPDSECKYPIKVEEADGVQKFSVTIPIADDGFWKPGLCYVDVWANLPNYKEPQLISTRALSISK